jgi:hypothetical protein
MNPIKLDWPHVAGATVIALVTAGCLYLKLIPDTAGVSLLTLLAGLFVPTTLAMLSKPQDPQ